MAITNAQQAKQIMNEGGPMEDIGFSIVKPSKNGKRPGYRSATYQSARSKSRSRSPSPSRSSNPSNNNPNYSGGNANTGKINNASKSNNSTRGNRVDTRIDYDKSYTGPGITNKDAKRVLKKREDLRKGIENSEIYKANEEKRRKEKEEEDKERRKKEKQKAKKETRDKRRNETKEDKKLRKMQNEAFRRFQLLEGYVDPFADYTTFAGKSGEEAANMAGYKGDLESGFEYDKDFFRDSKTGKIKDELIELDEDGIEQLRYNLNVGDVDNYRTAFPGYDFTQNRTLNKKVPVSSNFEGGLGTLTSNPGGVRPNDYGLAADSNFPSALKLVGDILRPETGLQALNTLEEARNVQDFAGRFAGGDKSAYQDFEDYVSRNKVPVTESNRDDSQDAIDPCKGPNPPAYCTVNNTPANSTPTRNLGGLAPRFAGSIFDFTGLADGGIARAGYMDGGMMQDTPEGGIMDLESGRQMYFLGKLVKKAKRAVKKITKSPFGKMALLGAGLGIAGIGPMKGLGVGRLGLKDIFAFGNMEKALNITSPGFKIGNFIKNNPYKSIFGGSALLGLMGGEEKKDEALDLGPEIDIDKYRYGNYLAPRFTGYGKADGGRIGYAEGSKEPVAKETMPLLDMDGQEMDLRAEGGFVPLGRMERADDVPARLSKNEFVFTADAVRNAGEGDIDKGAEVMYNMMKNLESGGEVSEESQGLDGAREMFQTSQRLEEVL